MSTWTTKLVAIAMIRPSSSRLEPRTWRLEALRSPGSVTAAVGIEPVGVARSPSSLMLVGSRHRDAAWTLQVVPRSPGAR